MARRVIKRSLNNRRIGKNIDRFDPNAIDADGDGMVQDATRFERPAAPKITGSIRRPEPEVWEKPEPKKPKPRYGIDNSSQTEGGSLYDEAVGPRPRASKPRDLQPILEPSQSILVDIAQEIMYAKSKSRSRQQTGRRKKRRPKSINNRVDNLTPEDRAQYKIDRDNLIREELIKGELSLPELAEIFELSPAAMAQKFSAELKINKRVRGDDKPKPRKLNDKTRQNIINDINNGMSAKKIAEKYDLHVVTVYKAFDKELKTAKDAREAEIRQSIIDGMTATQVINKYKTSPGVVNRIAGDIIRARGDAEENRARDRKRSSDMAKRRKLSGSIGRYYLSRDQIVERNERIVSRYNNGDKPKDIAAAENLTSSAVLRIINRLTGRDEYGYLAPVEARRAKRNKRIIDRYNNGDNVTEIAQSENLSRDTVHRILNDARESGQITGQQTAKEKISDRNKKIIARYNNGESPKDIAQLEGTTPKAVSWVLNQARKRGELTRERSVTLPKQRTPKQVMPAGKPKSDLTILDYYDSGLSVFQTAQAAKVTPAKVLETLVRNRIEDDNGRLTIPRKQVIPNIKISGSISASQPEKTMRDYINNPQLNIDAETVAKSIGFFQGWKFNPNPKNAWSSMFEAGDTNPLYHPQFSYDLVTGKPVAILGSRIDDYADEIVDNGTFEIQEHGGGNFGPGASFAFDGDPYMSEAYADHLAYTKDPQKLAERSALITRLNFKNPIVVNLGIREFEKPETYGRSVFTEGYQDIPRAERIAIGKEVSDEYVKSLGGEDRVRKLMKKYVASATLRDSLPMDALTKNDNEYYVKLFNSILNGDEDLIIGDRTFNVLARTAGHDGIIRLNLGASGEETSHMIVFDQGAIEVLGKRKLYSKKTVANKEIEKTIRAINKNPKKISGSISKSRPKKRAERVAQRKITGVLSPEQIANIKATPNSPVRTSGMISGAMSNENSRIGTKINTVIKVTKMPDGKYLFNINYGDIDIEFESEVDNYSSWVDAYDNWVGWRGNFGMRLASAALMGEELPDAAGYNGDEEGTHHHDLIATGKTTNKSRSEINELTNTVKNSIAALHHINSGKEINVRPVYRGLASISPNSDLMKIGKGSIIILPLSAFTSDIGTAKYYATRGDGSQDGVIIELLPGAKVGDAAGDEYLHEFKIDNDWVQDVTETVTQGKFRYVGTTTSFTVGPDGKSKKITKITLEQVETYNPLTGRFVRNTGKNGSIKGSITSSSKKDRFIERVGSIRPLIETIVPENLESFTNQAVQNYMSRNPVFIRELAAVEANDNWKTLPGAINPDGSPMTKAEYVASLKQQHRLQAQNYLAERLNKYSPDVNPHNLRQLRYNLEFMFATSPELTKLCDLYGYPQYAIFTKQSVTDKDGKTTFVENGEALSKYPDSAGNGITIVAAGISAILPYGNDAFIPKDVSINEALRDPRRLLRGHWGITPESYISGQNDDPLDMYNLLINNQMAQFTGPGKRIDIVDAGTPVGTLRHETIHSLHAGALARALLDVLEDPTNNEKKQRLSLLSMFNKPSWQLAIAIDNNLANTMINEAVSDYSVTTPQEWLAETLSAALSPHRQTRALLNFNHRAILSIAFPELEDYLTKDEWP